MNPHPASHQKLTKRSPPRHKEPSDSESSQIEEVEVEKALKMLRKLRKIDKKGRLSHFKSKSKPINALFAQMSQFFHQKQKKKIEERVKIVQERKAMSRRRFQSTVNSISAPAMAMDCIQAEPQQQQEQPPLSQQQQQTNLHPHGKLQVFCHTCCRPYLEIHHFYGQLCPECAAFNWAKRTQRADMTGLTALVTGARIKIGYEIALRLLREGATVYATSRFPNDTVLRYRKEADYDQWKSRLFIIQCDFLSQPQVSALIAHLQQNVEKLDILINNAAQTIVRPTEFYALEMRNEQAALENPHQVNCQALQSVSKDKVDSLPSLYSHQLAPQPGEIDTGELDEFGQPADKRAVNSWVQRLQDVSLVDCFTTQVINSIVPFHLISRLKDKLAGRTPSWVINVSSMEGVFYRSNKQHFHPHTNMAKAALNMLTRTSASDFKNSRIYMNAVDTGWVTNENPYHLAKKMTEVHHFKCPLDCLDGAMRVLDPIYQGLLKDEYPYGQFLKNYKSSNW